MDCRFMLAGMRNVWRLIGFSLLVLVAGLAAFTQWKAGRIAVEFPPVGKFVDVGGGRLHYTEKPAIGRERAVVLLLHGASGNNADVMAPLGDRLAQAGFRVLAFDRPGHGWSDRPGGSADASPRRQALLIRQAAERLGIARPIVAAHSMAGVLATNLAIEQQDFVAGLVLISPVTHPWPGGIAWYYTLASTPVVDQVFTRLLTLPLGLARFEDGLKSVFAPNPEPPDYLARTGAALLFRPSEFMANAQDVAALHDFVTEQSPRLKTITAPTAIVTGDTDSVVLTHIHSYGSARDIPGATLKVLEGVGHSPHWVAPDVVIEAVEAVAERAAAKPLVGAR